MIQLLVRHDGALRCALCHDAASEVDAICVDCGTICHPDCRAQAKHCPTLGCGKAVRPKLRVEAGIRPSAWGRWIGSFAALSTVAFLLLSVVMLNVVTVVPKDDDADRYRVAADMHALSSAIDLFRQNTGAAPTQLSDLNHAPPNVSDWQGPYLGECSPLDPWGNEYVYTPGEGSDWEIITYGADGSPGGVEATADLSSRTLLPTGD